MKRAAGRRDANQAAIVRALRAVGVSVFDLGDVGGGLPDLLVYRRATRGLYLLEVKTAKGKLTPAQVEFIRQFPVHVVRSVDEALVVVGATRESTARQ